MKLKAKLKRWAGATMVLVGLLGAAGCAAPRPVLELSDALMTAATPREPIVRREGAIPRLVLVMPVADERPAVVEGAPLARWPLVGLAAQWSPEFHGMPEVTLPRPPQPALAGGVPDALGRALAQALEETGGAAEAVYAADLTEVGDMRRFDYLLEVTLKSSSLARRRLDYGLNFFDVVNLAHLTHAFGLNSESGRGEWVFEVTLVERASGRVAAREQVGWKGDWVGRGWYQGSGRGLLVDALAPGFEAFLWETAGSVGKKIE